MRPQIIFSNIVYLVDSLSKFKQKFVSMLLSFYKCNIYFDNS
ncbi:MAG: hypothetical protein JWP81_4577 [Ferruginibacter sp.]|nr:hypothetical protein [Ferruginibacter sp.]